MRIIRLKKHKTASAVLLFLDRDADKGEDFVRLVCWHNTPDGLFLQESQTDVTNDVPDGENLLMRRYIADFSEQSALAFANQMKF